MSKIHHPDTGGDAEKFKKISEAYRILSDKEKRSSYDAGGNPNDILKAAESKEMRAAKILMEMFTVLVETLDPDRNNILEIIELNIANNSDKIKALISQEKRKRKNFESAIKRTKCSKENFFKEMAGFMLK